VASSDNFGTRGESPSHPELLDFLAHQFVNSGWSLKHMHRLIVLSNTYQQSAQDSQRALDVDPDNRLLSHFTRRRLSAEELRDAVLATSGQLDLEPGSNDSAEILWKEAEILDEQRGFAPNRMAADHAFYSDYRKRSIYLPIVRNMLPDVLALFDAADPNGVTTIRNETTVPSQSLFLLNSRFIREQSKHFAQRVLSDEKATEEQRLQLAGEWALGRPLNSDELKDAREFIRGVLALNSSDARTDSERQLAAWQSYCQTLFCQNEFLYCE
jgi:hypothetical protein